jgi:RHS repeat-associated protein
MQDDGNLVTYIFKWQAGVYAALTPGSYPSSSCSIGTYLVAGQMLPSGKCIVSPHGQYFLLMNTDGNFFIYDWAHGTGTWGPGTQGHPGAYAIFQTDGNLVVYDVNGTALWNSGTSGTNAERLDMNDDGRIIIWKSAWNSGTSNGQFNGTTYTHPGCDVGLGTGTTGVLGSGQCFVSPNGRFELLMQADGNMVIYDRSVTPNAAIWSTGTAVSPVDPSVALRTLYSYDALGNLYCVEQHGDSPAGPHGDGTAGTGCSADPSNDASSTWRVRRFTYDSLSRLLTAKNPESGTITYIYDADGELLQKTSPAPNVLPPTTATQTVSYCYDELHRVTGKGYGAQSCPLATPVVTYAYDSGANAKGHLTSLTDQGGTASYGYDILGRLATETRTLTGANNASISKNLSYEYNLDGSLYKLHYPSGAVVTYTPDSAGRTLSAVDGGSGINYITGATYGPDSALTGFVSGSGGAAAITSSFTYNKRLQPLTMSATAPSQTVYSIGYDFHAGNGTAGTGTDNGNVFGIINYKDTTHGRDQTFTYDALNRLISAQNAGTNCSTMVLQNKTEYWGNSYSYDAWSNLLQKTITKCGAEHLLATADAQNRIHVPTPDYIYDAAGNMTTDVTDGVTAFYDQESRVSTATSNGITTTYSYDSDGNRVRKSTGNLAANGTLYWYMAPGVVAETDLAGTTQSEYIFFDGERVARRDGATGTGGVFYYFSDHLKTASVITDSAGVIKAESDYYPWGGELQFVNNDSNHYKFTGKERDPETGLDYFGARYYSNGLGRWVSADWSSTPVPVPYADLTDPQTLNLYGYVRGLPTTKADFDGHGFWRKLSNWATDDGCFCEDTENKKHQEEVRNQRQQQAAKEQWDLVDSPAAKQWAKDHGGVTFRDALQAGAMAYAAAQVEFGYGPGPKPLAPVAEEEGPVEVTISRSQSPAAAQHIDDAQAAGQPEVVTMDRSGTQGAARAAARGRAATSRTATAPGMDRDEYPPKCCAEGGKGASVRSIPSSDNRSAGAQLGNQTRTLPDGTKVRIKTGP